jgi:KDO2-lipid IV(A) lauroyltransferase
VTAALIEGALRAAGWLPLPLLHALGAALGLAFWWLPSEQRRITLRHLELCLPELDRHARRRLARASLIESGKAVAETPAIWFGPLSRLRRWLDDSAAAAALAAARNERGLILLTPHLGSWELAGQFAAQQGPITFLYKPQDGVLDALMLAGRGRLPQAHPVPTDAGGVKALLAALRRGETVGVLPDHSPPEGSGVYAPLFGIPAYTMELVTRLAARTGAPVWFIVAERLSWGRGFRCRLVSAEPGIADPSTGPAVLNAGLEALIRAYPRQYWWSYRRFRKRPPEEGARYPGV